MPSGPSRLDKNGTTLQSETSFEGASHIGLIKGSPPTSFNTSFSAQKPAFQLSQDYLGSFTVCTKFDESGKSVTESRSASGIGSASSEQRVSDRQRSYEYGTGTYQAEEEIQTQTNYMAKEINATFAPQSFSYTPRVRVNLSSKWNEGMWSRSGSLPAKGSSNNSIEPTSFIGEEYSQADYLNKSTVALGLNQMKTEAQFQGRARFKAVYDKESNQSRDQLELYDEYVGKYSLTRNVEI